MLANTARLEGELFADLLGNGDLLGNTSVLSTDEWIDKSKQYLAKVEQLIELMEAELFI